MTMSISPQRKTAEAVVAAFNRMDVEAIISYRSPDCVRQFLPLSMGFKDQNNAVYRNSLIKLRAIFYNFHLTINDLVEDTNARRISLWLTARADTAAGEYVNEYMWLLDFNESGTKIRRSKEFSDTIMARDFFPKLQAAMDKQQAGQANRKVEAVKQL
ncbi:hypothetical protein N7G274_007010 [Stereocaulon virgatum]|uniref:SnoaL-like domain-containing protein n=1 Tax=Stereocaulon virgatum TaxID=373712 RepID=A0ABR4A2C9_9LECA